MAFQNKNKGPKNTLEQQNAPVQELRLLVGIEVDGTQVHVAYVEPHGSIRVEHFEGPTPAKALDSALNAIPSKATIVRVAFTGGRQFVRRVDVPRVPDRAMRAAIMSIAEDNLPIIPGSTSVAALVVGDLKDDFTSSEGAKNSNMLNMVIAAVESDDLDPVWRRLGGRKAPITSSTFLLPADGLYFRVARSVSEVILLEDGLPLVSRALRIGGLDELDKKIEESQSPNTSFTQNEEVQKTPQEITDEFLDELVSEFRKTLIFWKREGTDVPDELIALGAGANTPTLLTRIADTGINILPIPEPRGYHLDIEQHEKPLAFQALASAYSDFSNQPYAILPNPVYEAERENAKRKAKQRSIALISLIAFVGLIMMITFPLIYATLREQSAKDDKDKALKELALKQKVIDANDTLILGETALNTLEIGLPAYSKVLCSLITTRQEIVPGSPAIFKSISVTSTTEGPAIDTSIEIADPENGFAKSLGVWQVLLQKAASTEKIGVGTFKDTTGVKDFSFKYVYPLSSSYLVPNVANCDGYVNGLSPEQQFKIANGYDANDKGTKFNKKGVLVNTADNTPASTTSTTTTSTTTTTAPIGGN
ncbi:MAG: hypothetical protein KBF89_03315 [Acidimicrobiia bacterium]|nr:hypothetical protein [Acidimicrobiia bacterium]